MTSRSLRITAAALVTVALAACSKPADKPAVVDSAANATQTETPLIDSAAKVDTTKKADTTMPATVAPTTDSAASVKK